MMLIEIEKNRIRKGKKRINENQKTSPVCDPNEVARSVIVFVASCKTCQLVSEIINELGMKCVVLHSMMSQNRRLADIYYPNNH